MPLAKKLMQEFRSTENLDQNLEVGKAYDNAIKNQLNKT